LFLLHNSHKAIHGSVFGADNATLIEVLCQKNAAEIKQLKEAYKKLFNHELIDEVLQNTGGFMKGDYQRLLLSLLRNERPETAADEQGADADAQKLFSAGEGKFFGTDEDTFIRILSTSSFAHLKRVFEKYVTLGKHHDIETAIKDETSGPFKNALLLIVHTTKVGSKREREREREREMFFSSSIQLINTHAHTLCTRATLLVTMRNVFMMLLLVSAATRRHSFERWSRTLRPT
jgi:hypothetical protein